jgi:hypothetical protein
MKAVKTLHVIAAPARIAVFGCLAIGELVRHSVQPQEVSAN